MSDFALGPYDAPAFFVSTTQTLPVGTVRNVFLSNAAPITVSLPGASRRIGQEIIFKDILGNAGSFPVTVDGNGATIDGGSTRSIFTAFGLLRLVWNGTQWSIMQEQPQQFVAPGGSVPRTSVQRAGEVINALDHLVLASDGTINSTQFDAMMSYVTSVSGTGFAARLPKLGAKPLFFPSGDYKSPTFRVMQLWGTGATIKGEPNTTVLDNIGIELIQWRHPLIKDLLLAQRNQVITPKGTYALWVHESPRGGLVSNLNILYRDIGIKVNYTNHYSPFPAQCVFDTIYQQFGRIGLFVQGPFAVQMTDSAFLGNNEYCWLLYGPQGFKPHNCFVNGGGNNAMKITGNERRPSTDSYFSYITSTGTSLSDGTVVWVNYPILSKADDGAGNTRITLATKIATQISNAGSIMSWDPYIEYAKCMCLVSGTTGGQVSSIKVGAVELLSAPVVWQGTIALTVQAIKNNINGGTGTHGFTSFAAATGSSRFYIDKVGDTDATRPAALAIVGQAVVTIVTGDVTCNPEPYIAVQFVSPHGFSQFDLIYHKGFVTSCVGYIDNGLGGGVPSGVAGTVMTINTVNSGDPITVGQGVHGTSAVIVTSGTTILSQLSGTPGGIGTYQVSVASNTINGSLTIGGDDYDGEMKIAYVPNATTILYQMSYTVAVLGQAWRLLQMTNGEGQCQISGAFSKINLQLSGMDDVSIVVNVPWDTLTLPSTFQTHKFDVSYEVLDTSAIRLNDHFWIHGNVNYFEINGYNHIYWMPRPGKNFLWVSEPANRSFRPQRIFFIRPGRGRTTNDDDPDTDLNIVPICGSSSGWTSFSFGEGDTSDGAFIKMAMPAPGPKNANQPKMNEFQITPAEMQMILGSTLVAKLNATSFEMPWFRTAQQGTSANINRVLIQGAAPGGTPQIRSESSGATPDANVSLSVNTTGTGFLREFLGGVEYARLTTASGIQRLTATGTKDTYPSNRAGEVVLVAGTSGPIAVSGLTGNSRIDLTRRIIGGTVGTLSYTINTGPQTITINSDNVADTSTVSWKLWEMS
jgi:hypothetical protein